MKELKGIFKPEISPIHKMDYSIATQLTLDETAQKKEVIPAGTLLKSKTSGKSIELVPTAGASIATVADVAEPLAVLAHDVIPEDGVADYSVGVMIRGVVYKDVMTLANTAPNFTDEIIAKLAPNILVYDVKTLKK